MKITDSKRFWVWFLFLFVVFVVPYNQAVSKTAKPVHKSEAPHKKSQTQQATAMDPANPGSFQFDAKAVVLMDALTGQVLYEQNPEMRIAPASFVKVMTLYVVFDAIRAGQMKMEDLVTVSEKAWRRAYKTDSSKMFIRVGDRVKVEDLIKGVAIASGNDACVALAEQLAGSEEAFVLKMNEKAKLLGLNNCQFRNSDGLPAEGQYVTALDMSNLSRRYLEDHPEAIAIHSTVEFEYNGTRQENRNTLIKKGIGVDGLKTGHIKESGYHLVATAKRDQQRMIAVVMGCEKIRQRAVAAQTLLEYGFKNFSTVEAVKKGATFGPLKVKRGKLNEVVLTASEDVRVTVAKGKEKSITATPQVPPFVVAPVQKGQMVAKVLIQNEGKTVKEVNLVSASEVKKSLIPPLPVLAGCVAGLIVIILIGFWWFRRPKQKILS
jgi:D-alanyl-D-alanine carboxypeptidase (penicillin-binding protein 5/6)